MLSDEMKPRIHDANLIYEARCARLPHQKTVYPTDARNKLNRDELSVFRGYCT